MEYKEIKPCKDLAPFIHAYWELKGSAQDGQWERIFPDGCAGLVMNLGDTCSTDNGSVAMTFGKTYAVGAMTSFKDSFIDCNTHLLGVCLKPATFANFYSYASQHELTGNTVRLERSDSFDLDKIVKDPFLYLNRFFTDSIQTKNRPLQAVIHDIHTANGQLSIPELAKRNYTTVRQLERHFKTYVGISPKEYANIIRFQHALNKIKNADAHRSLLDIALECGYYDHAHLTNEIKRRTGLSPARL